ncbi:tetratricopeptide repeat protein [Clostridium manihotivorum]|uniref:Uncharacterized protein n=1 Tax=Clostridium manihotivorum TaxID=2320868 RepID=A0A410DSE1_9CLOT|nr:hypothetical protein [Clostridium manihotivorum]QAA32123.1 hypothetical protein C1I91_10915 [Clostridium manihotivorum]
MVEFMNKTREIYYNERKKSSFTFNDYNILLKPMWMKNLNDNRYAATYKDQSILKRKGRIAIGTIVQANYRLFSLEINNNPAVMVFSEDPYFEENPKALKAIASELTKIKGKVCNDEKLQGFADILDDEIVTLFNAKLPESITFGKEVYLTTFMVHREQLPNRYIDFEYFPVLMCPEKTEASIILPSRYWASEVGKEQRKTKLIPKRKLKKLLYEDPMRYINGIDAYIKDTVDRGIRASEKKMWERKISYYRFQKSTALINCGKYQEAEDLLRELLSYYNMSKAEQNGDIFYSSILINLISPLIEQDKFSEARRYILMLEKAISNIKSEKHMQSFYLSLEYRKIQLDILDGDLERGVHSINKMLEEKPNDILRSSLYLYYGIYYFKKGNKNSALDYFDRTLKLIKTPGILKKVEYYKRKC